MQTSPRSANEEVARGPAFSREELLTVDEVAAVLRVTKATATDYMRRGVIPAFKLGRSWYALRPRLDAYLEAATNPYTKV
jgi:excisionase family DNA binding protein